MANSARLRLPPASSCRRLPVPTNTLSRPVKTRLLPTRRRLRATDAARRLDHVEEEAEKKEARLRIAIVGFGNYGQFLARTFVAQGHTVLAHSRSDHSAAAASIGATFFPDARDLCECHPDVVLLATSILSTEGAVLALPVHRLRRGTLFVKEFPKKLLSERLPADFDVVCTHPMFGPESARDGGGWAGLPFVFDRVRVRDRAEAFLAVFAREGCRMVEMPCEEHAAGTQFLTHTVGRMLALLRLEATPVDTKGYETLLRLVDNTCSDSFDLYNGLFMYNNNSTELLNRLEWALDSVKRKPFHGLHDVLRKQLFDLEVAPPDPIVPALVVDDDLDDAAPALDGDESSEDNN
jgi:arogenate dehydrogenase (NADP+), plant